MMTTTFIPPARPSVNRSSLCILVLTLAVTSCAKGDKGSETSSVAPGAALASGATSAALPANPTTNDIANYPLDMDKVRKLAATMKYMEEAARLDSTVVSGGSNSETAAQTIARLEGKPQLVAVFRKAGWNAADYVWTMAALLQASMMESVLANTAGAKLPEGQSPKNIEFMRANKAEIEQITKEMGMSGQS